MGRTIKKISNSNKISKRRNKTNQIGILRRKRLPTFDELVIESDFEELTLPSTAETTKVRRPCLNGRLASDFLKISEYKQQSLDRRNTIVDIENSVTNDGCELEYIPYKQNCIKRNKKVCFSTSVEFRDELSDAEKECLDVQNGSTDEYEDIEFNFLKHKIHEISLEGEHDFRITLYREAIVYIHGLIAVHVLQGSVEILGYKLTASDNKTFNIYSPAGSSLLSISNCTKSNNSDNAVVLCKKLDAQLSQSLSLYAPKNIYPALQENGTQCIADSANFFTNFSLFLPSPKWEGFANTLTPASRVIIAGNKNTGKSTLLRYFVNQLLSNSSGRSGYEHVLVVDLDPGQPEFTPPGCISITVVKSPLLGPSYTHQQIPEKCVHISNIDIKYNMDEYIRCCKYLLSSLQNYGDIPTLVNYIGYSKGLGQELISTIISFINPTNVVQINDPNRNYNFRKELTIDNVKEDAKWIPDGTDHVDLSFELVQFETMHNVNKLNRINYTAGQFRDIAIVSYFSNILKGDPLCLTDPKVRIYSAPLDKLKVQDSLGNSHPAMCNANLVSLCKRISFENNDVFNCIGWGIVRCISIPRNRIYILTPTSLDLLEQVEYLVVSSVRLPLAMYITTAKDISGQIPYIEDGQQTDLEKPSKRHHYKKAMR